MTLGAEAMNDPAYAFQMAGWKLQRADQHSESVKSVIKWVVDPDNYIAAPYKDPKTGHYMLRVGAEGGGLPHELATWAGDAVHNLNTALDYLWSGLARQTVPHFAARAPRHETREN